MLRRLIVLAWISSYAAPRVSAREETWLNARDPENASYFSPRMRASRLGDSVAVWPGLGIGWIVGSVVSVGFEGYLLAADPRDPSAPNPLSIALGGMDFQATPFPEHRTHPAFDLLIGMGGSQMGGESGFDSLSRHGFFFVAPGAKLEFNLTRNIRLAPGAGYLWTPDPVYGLEAGRGLEGPMLGLDLVLKQPDPG